MMFIKQFVTGGDRNYGYLVADDTTKLSVVIDPSYSPKQIAEFAQVHSYVIQYVFNTHGHYDHKNGNKVMKRLTGRTPLLFGDLDPLSGLTVLDGARFPLGGLKIIILHTPGHTKDSVCLYIGDAVFTGDTLFVGKIGGTCFRSRAQAQYNSLHQKLLTLPESTRVFPGHNYGTASESTIGHERQTNPFLLQKDFKTFLNLKRHWKAYKKAHGIV